MRLHRTTCVAVVESLEQIFTEKKYADKVIEKTLKKDTRWGSRDRKFIAETTYDIVRWYRFFRSVTNAKGDDFWTLLAAWCISREIDLPDWKEFSGIPYKQFQEKILQNHPTRKINESIPDWMDELGEKELGKRWDAELTALNEEARVVLRVNTLKTSVKELRSALEEKEIFTEIDKRFPDALILEERQNVFQLPEFKEGLFEVQDAGSQAISHFANPKPGMRIIDACAGGGGKTLHLAALTQSKGRIISMDTEQWKLDELKKRARRAGVSTVETRLIDSSKVIKRLEKTADLVLLDVPCSGLGVLKRNPDAKWKLSPAFIDDVRKAQQEILSSYSEMVKPGGVLIYATCSVLYSENEDQVKKFLGENGSFELKDEKRIWPSEGFDGFYMARLLRKS
ncbi:MAG TPA: RsmB/NOP family class I SAM-dependent RNA methyltransferase [Cyclobacteriaceae bacterium]|nr:RsmB/NOP family class I SAM-dependent RNA methyltransferase [Cyclobacteriaceae bacterium]